MKTKLLVALVGSFARHSLPAATSFLAGYGINVSSDNPMLSVGIAVVVYGVAQAISFVRQIRKHQATA